MILHGTSMPPAFVQIKPFNHIMNGRRRTVIDVNAAAEDVTGLEAPLWYPRRRWPPVGVPDTVVDPLQPSPGYHLEKNGSMGMSRKVRVEK